jgi:hypothetical protein
MWKHKPTYMSHWGPVGGRLDMQQAVTCHTRVTNSPLPVTGQSSVCYRVFSSSNVPRKCINSSYAFCYICGEVTFKFRRRSFTTLIKKCYEYFFFLVPIPLLVCLYMLWILFRLQSWLSGQELGSSFLLCDMCQASHGMGKRFTLYAFRHSYGLERAHGPCSRLLLLPDQYHWLTAKSKHTVQYPNLPSAMRAVPHSAELPVPKSPTNMTLSDSE